MAGFFAEIWTLPNKSRIMILLILSNCLKNVIVILLQDRWPVGFGPGGVCGTCGPFDNKVVFAFLCPQVLPSPLPPSSPVSFAFTWMLPNSPEDFQGQREDTKHANLCHHRLIGHCPNPCQLQGWAWQSRFLGQPSETCYPRATRGQRERPSSSCNEC